MRSTQVCQALPESYWCRSRCFASSPLLCQWRYMGTLVYCADTGAHHEKLPGQLGWAGATGKPDRKPTTTSVLGVVCDSRNAPQHRGDASRSRPPQPTFRPLQETAVPTRSRASASSQVDFTNCGAWVTTACERGLVLDENRKGGRGGDRERERDPFMLR